MRLALDFKLCGRLWLLHRTVGCWERLTVCLYCLTYIIYCGEHFFKCFRQIFCPLCRNMRGRRSWLFHLSLCSFLSIPFFAGDIQNITRVIFVNPKTEPRPSGALLRARGRERNKNANLPEAVTECLTAPRRGARGGEASVFFYAPRLVRGASGHP